MKRRGGSIVLTAAAVTLVLSASASAQAKPLKNGVAPADVMGVLEKEGFDARLTTDTSGDPLILTSLDGSNFGVYFYDCKEGRCEDIQFATAIDLPDGMTLEAVNRWNREKRFGRVYLDDENDPFIEMDIGLKDGASTELIAYHLLLWRSVVDAFRTYVDPSLRS